MDERLSSKEAMRLALEALEICSVRQEHQWQGLQKMQMAEHALREALAEQKSGIKQVIELYDSPDQPSQQEPVAYMDICEKNQMSGLRYWSEPDNRHEVPLYTSPPAQRTWVGLTDEERHACTQSPFTTENFWAIEAKLKEKNTYG